MNDSASSLLADVMLLRQIRATLLKNPGEFPSLEGTAKKMKMGSRTLRRRLAKENLKYQQILDDTRKELAIQYLEHTTLTPKEIGFLLGYASVSNFRRAFKSWTGKKLTSATRVMVEPLGPLSGRRVLEIADEKGVYCGKLFADMGAEVIKIECPGGDATRLIPPFWGGAPHPEKGLFFLYTNTNKKSVTLDLETPEGRDGLLRLKRWIWSSRPCRRGGWPSWGWGMEP